MNITPVEFDPFRGGEIARTVPSTEPQREIIASAYMSHEANTAFNEAVSLRVCGSIDSRTIEAALRTIVDRHDALRTTFTQLGDELCVTERNEFALERLDFAGIDEPARDARILSLWRELVSTPMNLFEGPLFRAIWIQLDENLGELVLLAHHVVCDGWSFHVILEELSELCSGKEAQDLEEAPSFADFAERQNARAVSNADVDYWAKRFESRPPVLDLPADRVRPPLRSFAAARLDRAFDAELAKAIALAAGKLKASVVNVALAGTAALLHRLTDTTDIAIGLPVARQSADGIPGLVGHGVQLLPIRLQVDPTDRFQDLVGRAKTAILDAREHFDFTFGALIRDLGLGGDPSRVPLVPVIFNIDQPFGELKLGGASATFRTVPRTAENFEIFLNILPAQNQLVVEATFNTDLFSPGTVGSWLEALENLLADGTANPSKPVSALSLARQRPEIDTQLNTTARVHPPGSWLDRLAGAAAKSPDAVAIVDGRGTLTYAELVRRSSELAQLLAQQGVTRGSVVGLHMTRSCELLIALSAVHKAGAAYLPLDPSFPESRLAFMLADSSARLLLTDIELPVALAQLQIRTLRLPQTAAGQSPGARIPEIGSSDLAYIIYTSGSTGKPKGVEVTHGGVINFLDSMATRPGLNSTDTLLAVTTLSFDISVLELLLPLTQGGRVVVATRDDAGNARKLAELLSSHEITVMQATPSTWRLLLGDGWPGRKSLTALCGGEALSPDLAAALLGKVKTLWNLYGPTETTVWSSCERLTPDMDRVSIGSPIDNTVMYIMDAHGQELPTAIPGEICIGGAGLARGYHARPELTAERFVEHPRFGRLYRTGDRGRLLGRGVIEHLGRLDFQVKVRGYRIELGEIEASLASNPEIAQAVVIAREDRPGDVRLVAYLVLQSGHTITDSLLRAHLQPVLPEYMVPQHFVTLPAMPLLPNGKLDRRSLPPPDRPVRTSTDRVAPTSDLEKSVIAVMEDVLALAGLGIHDSFFALGGHSLLASQLASRLGKKLGIQIPMRTVFEAPTTAQLVSYIERQSKAGAAQRWIIPRRPDRGTAPLSMMQQRLWFLEQVNPGRIVYNTPGAQRLSGKLDEVAFARAFSEMVRRQDSLRTVIATTGTQTIQLILPEVQSNLLPVEDLRNVPSGDREQDLLDRLDALMATPLRLTEPPLFRAKLFRLDDEEYAFFFMAHHIIWDGWSFDLVYQEMAVLYDAFTQNKPSPLPDLTVSYGDFAAWHNEWMQGKELAVQLAHWKERLAGQLEPLAVPTDHPRPPRMSGGGNTTWLSIPVSTVEHLREFGLRADATLFMSALAAYVLLLHQVTGQRDIIVGIPVRGRQAAELEPIMGFFVNALPLRFRIAENATFAQLLQEVRDCVLDAFRYPDVPFEQLVRELKIVRDESRFPIYQTMFSFQDARQRILRWGNLDHERIQVMQPGIAEDIDLWFIEVPDGLVGGITYNTDILSESTALLLRDRYIHVVDTVLANPDLPIARLPLAQTEVRKLVSWNETATAFDRDALMHSLFEAQARLAPKQIALRCGDASITYGELDARANRLAHALRARGARRGRLIGLCVERGIEMVALQLAVLKSGAAYVPLDPAYPRERIAFMAEDAGLTLLVTESAYSGLLGWPRDKMLCIDTDIVQFTAQPDMPLAADDGNAQAGDAAYVIYTSGSTGKPKGVVVPHRAVVNFLASMAREPGLAAGDVLLAVTTLSFDIAVLELQLPLTLGATVVIASRDEAIDGRALSSLLAKHRVSVMQATPATWRLLLESGWSVRPPFKALVGGEAMPKDLAEQLIARGVELWNMYGPTETTVWSTCARITDTANGIPIGKPIANTVVRILDPQGNLCPIGVPGELCIGGEGVALGYWNRPELSAERFIADPFSPGGRLYRSGDRARWRHDGMLEHLGRFDFQVKLRGYRIELGEIEAGIAQHPAIRGVVVSAREDVPGDKRLVAYLVTENAPADLHDQLRALIRASMPTYMVPAHFVDLDALPLTENGKVDRKALPNPHSAEHASGASSYVAPRTDLEISLATVWERVLGVGRVGITDNFFELGGNSLGVLKLILEMEDATGIEIDLGEVFRSPTIAELVTSLGPEATKNASIVVPLQTQGDGLPIFCLCGINIYKEFAESLGKGQPVYGVYVAEEQALVNQVIRGNRPEVSIERLTDAYYQAIARFRPEGPYRLAGLSFGGILAMELASKLRRRGAQVDLVILLDTMLPQGIRRNWAKWLVREAAEVRNGNARRSLGRLMIRLRDRYIGRPLQSRNQKRADSAMEVTAIKRFAFVQVTNKWQANNLMSDFRVVLFRGSDRSSWGIQTEFDEDYGWRSFLGDQLSTVNVPGNHLSIMELPNVAELGEKARSYLGPGSGNTQPVNQSDLQPAHEVSASGGYSVRTR